MIFFIVFLRIILIISYISKKKLEQSFKINILSYFICEFYLQYMAIKINFLEINNTPYDEVISQFGFLILILQSYAISNIFLPRNSFMVSKI